MWCCEKSNSFHRNAPSTAMLSYYCYQMTSRERKLVQRLVNDLFLSRLSKLITISDWISLIFEPIATRRIEHWKVSLISVIMCSCSRPILGDPGATSRDDAIFSGESLLQELKSSWELILTETVPEVVEFRPADWAEKYVSVQSAWTSTGVTLSPSYAK